jgi:hypothetical protein
MKELLMYTSNRKVREGTQSNAKDSTKHLKPVDPSGGCITSFPSALCFATCLREKHFYVDRKTRRWTSLSIRNQIIVLPDFYFLLLTFLCASLRLLSVLCG